MDITENKLLLTKVGDLFKYSKCLCEEKILYNKCLKCNKKYVKVSDFFKKSLDDFLNINNTKGSCCILNECWSTCNNPAIRSHTISKQAHLSSLLTTNHKKVYTLNGGNSYLLNKNKYSNFDAVSSEEIASIFYGLCKKHDEIYKPIDDNFDYGNKQHLILLAHRQSLYELHKKIEMLNLFKNIKEIFKKIKKEKLEIHYKKIISLAFLIIEKKITDINFLINDLKIEIDLFKEDFDIIDNKAIFKEIPENKYLCSILKFEKKMDFLFSAKFAPKYTFNEQLIHRYWDSLYYKIQSPTIGLINHKNNAYFYFIAINNNENLYFEKTLINEIKSKINTLLKCAIMTDNTYFSEEFVLTCRNSKTCQEYHFINKADKNKFDTVDKLLGYINLQDSLPSYQFDGELERIKNINNIDFLDIIPKNNILYLP